MSYQCLLDTSWQEDALLDPLEVDCALVIIVINFEEWWSWHYVFWVKFFLHCVAWVHVVVWFIPDKLTWRLATIGKRSR